MRSVLRLILLYSHFNIDDDQGEAKSTARFLTGKISPAILKKIPLSFRADPVAGFTLIELLIVIAILAILAAVVVIVINPAEILAQARDAERISSIKSIKDSVDLFIVDNPSASLGTAQVVSISIPDASSSTCANVAGLPTLPAGWSYRCVTAINLRNTNGTGWVPLDLGTIKGGSPIPYLPIDPQNDPATTRYYQYISGANASYELTALMESEKQAKVAGKDGGTDAARIESGPDISLWRAASGLVSYFPFDGSGSISTGQTNGFQDLSASNNNGVSSNVNGSGMSFVTGKSGSGVQLDGVDDYVSSPYIPNIINRLTITSWINPATVSGTHEISNQEQWDGGPWTGWRLRQSSNTISLKLGDGTSNTYSYSAGEYYKRMFGSI